MLAEQSLREGKLSQALSQLEAGVREDPANTGYRVFLFQLLALLGDWDRARTQLSVLAEMDAGTLAMVRTYEQALRCEVLRESVFAGRRSPIVFGKPDPWVALLVEALRLTAGERHDEARELRDRAFEEAPASTGTIDQQPFEWIADADSRLGPILEAIVNGRYHWIPFDRIRRIQLERPADLRDSVWMPVHFTWANGGDAVGLVPSRYPGSERSVDNLIQSARKTEWIESGDAFLGLGQRMLTTDQGEHPLLDIRSIVLDARAVEPAFADGEGSGQSGQQEQRDGGDGAGGVMDASHGGG